MKRILLFISCVLASIMMQASNTLYFPTGMTWEEIVVDPWMELEDDNAHVYEISTDTLIGNVTYKKVLMDNLFSGICVRESGDKVWLLTKDYPTEILLYDFDWDANQEIVTEYLKGQAGGGYKICRDTISVGDCQSVMIDGKAYQYVKDNFTRSLIRGIGKVAELNRYPCLLCYREPSTILPGLEYRKVHWILRNGVEIFRSEDPKEWTEIPGGSETEINGHDYRPLVEEGKHWTYFFYNETGKTFDVSRVVDSDTIIGRLTYKKILDNVGGQYLYALREEGKKVYIVYNHQETPSLLYDFSKDKGEMVCGFRVADVDTIDIDGAKFRRMRIIDTEWKDEEIPWWAGYWIEGVGSECLLEANYRQTGNYYNLKSCQINGRTYTQRELLKETSKPEETYRPFVEEGKVWKVGNGNSNPIQFVEYYYFDGDTIIDGKTCKQMMCQRYVTPDYPDYAIISQYPYLSYVGAWYEEDQKVYEYNTTDKQFHLKYDFSVDDNAPLQIHGQSYVIGPKQSGGMKGFKGVYRDVLWGGGELYHTYNTSWLEGVGGIEGPPYNVYYGEEYHGGAFLMSCTVGDEVIYLNDVFEDGATPEEARKHRFDFTHTVKTQPKAPASPQTSLRRASGTVREAEQPLYGEYNDLQLGIHLDPLDEAYLVRITDETGTVVYEKAVNAGTIVGLNIDISAYPKGLYTVTVENNRESFTGEIDTRTTGISLTPAFSQGEGAIYNLQGQRISSLQRGLNIINRRKIYVR